MSRHRFSVVVGLSILILVSTCVGFAQGAAGPQFDVKATWAPTILTAGEEGQFAIWPRNIGDAPGTEEDLTITDKLPDGVEVMGIYWSTTNVPDVGTLSTYCGGIGSSEVNCNLPATRVPALAPAPANSRGVGIVSLFPSGDLPTIYVDVRIKSDATGTGVNSVTIDGGGAAQSFVDTDQVAIGPSTSAGLSSVPGSFVADMFSTVYPGGQLSRQASDRPFEFRTNFDLTARTGKNDGGNGDTSRYITSNGQVRTVEVSLPRGMIGNPEATPKCNPADFAEVGAVPSSTACPPDTQVGYLTISVAEGTHSYARGNFANVAGFLSRIPLYNLRPPKGAIADFAFSAGGIVQAHIFPVLDPSRGYAVKFVSPDISNLVTVRGVEVTGWGVPADPAHDKFRYVSGPLNADPAVGAAWGSAPIRPILTNPSDCGVDNGHATIRMDSYNRPEQFSSTQEAVSPLIVTGCDDPRFRFEPEVMLQPTDRHAGAPTGLDVHLKVPQRNDEVEEAKELYAAKRLRQGDLRRRR